MDFKELGICPKCRDSIKTAVSITYRGRLQIFAGSVYTSDLSRVILAAKEENQIQARIFLAKQLSQSLEKALKDISINRSQRIEDVVIIQSTVVEDINRNVTEINDITQRTAQTAQAAAQASKALNQLANRLDTLVARFKV